jgi:hypothetical protein
MDTRRSYYLHSRQDDFAEPAADASQLDFNDIPFKPRHAGPNRRHSGREEEGPMDEQGLRQSGQWSRRAG